MDRSTIHYLKQKGWTNTQIAQLVGHHRETVARALREPLDKKPAPRDRPSSIAVYDDLIRVWIEEDVPVTRMLELARSDPKQPYKGGPTAFFDYVRKFRRNQGALPTDLALRFEGLPGEFLQIDWGEVRNFPFVRSSLQGQTRYFFAARLKYSRFMWVRFTTDMREETLLRCIISSFEQIGGVPWVVTTDNMKTIVLGRDPSNQPIWHPAFQKLAAEFGFHPEACAPAAGNQKGAVENLVGYVKSNFLAGRIFHDDQDLDRECAGWLHEVNVERPCQATEQIPIELLSDEQAKFGPLPAASKDYGFFDSLIVTREGVVHIDTNRYSVPVQYAGQVVTARIHQHRIDLYVHDQLVASHKRHWGRNARIVDPAHFELAFPKKPRARVMIYRDWLVGLSPSSAAYISVICRKRRSEMEEHILSLYQTAQRLGTGDFLCALELAAEQQLYGAEYIEAITSATSVPSVTPAIHTRGQYPTHPQHPQSTKYATHPTQQEIERDLAQYECYVSNLPLLQLQPQSQSQVQPQITVGQGAKR
jgi:transposase